MATNAFSADSVDWDRQAEEDAKQDFTTIIFDGKAPNQLACDTTVRPMPDGSWVTVMLGGGHTEPLPANRVFISRSRDQGKTWTPMRPIDLGIKSKDPTRAITLSELTLHGRRTTMVLQVHNGGFGEWKTYFVHTDDSCHTWSALEPAPGKLADRTMIRNAIKTRDGRILMPYQHYNRCDETGHKISKGRVLHTPRDPRAGVIESLDGGRTWDLHGDVRLTADDNYHGWAEPNIVELSDGTIAMIVRADRLGGVLYYAESKDGGHTWPEFARKTTIPNPGSKATLYGLGGDTVAILHNPNPRHRNPLALWISFDGLKTWPYRRVLAPESCDEGGRINYPDGFVSDDGKFLNFAFDDNRHRCVFYRAKLPADGAVVEILGGRKVFQADLKALGIAEYGDLALDAAWELQCYLAKKHNQGENEKGNALASREYSNTGKKVSPRLELFFDGAPMEISRWPNHGFTKIDKVLGETKVEVRGVVGCKEGIFSYTGDRFRRWTGEKDAFVKGYWFRDWSVQCHKIASIDPEKRVISVEQPYHNYSGYRFLNREGVRGHVDAAGDPQSLKSDSFVKSYIELHAAGALVRCGDHHGLGRDVLTDYLDDWRGISVRYAGHVLGENTKAASDD